MRSNEPLRVMIRTHGSREQIGIVDRLLPAG